MSDISVIVRIIKTTEQISKRSGEFAQEMDAGPAKMMLLTLRNTTTDEENVTTFVLDVTEYR